MAASSAIITDMAVPLQLCRSTIIVDRHVCWIAGADELDPAGERLGPRLISLIELSVL
jgi:hypothetical protein